jgi:hypothetical protein
MFINWNDFLFGCFAGLGRPVAKWLLRVGDERMKLEVFRPVHSAVIWLSHWQLRLVSELFP